MYKYVYNGPVMVFGTYICNWKGSTYAPSENKARNNLTYQYKKLVKQIPGAKVTLPGKIVMEEK